MMPERLARYETTLGQLERKGRRRALARQSGIDFTSNDYLGLAGSARLKASVISALERGVPVGAGGSRLLRGNHPEHEALEVEAAAFFNSERMLYFGSGYAANVAILSTLPQRNDLVVYDELIHASAHAGIAAGRATAVAVPHNDLDAFEDVIRKWRQAGGKGHPWIVVESLYSMDGDRAPLAGLAGVSDRYDGFLLVDEAHATGVHGADGRGFSTELEGATMSSCSIPAERRLACPAHLSEGAASFATISSITHAPLFMRPPPLRLQLPAFAKPCTSFRMNRSGGKNSRD
jgi:8-amino-7-oxononanoate synthase